MKEKSGLDQLGDMLPSWLGGDVVRLKQENKRRLEEITKSGETKDDDSKRPQGSDTK